MKIALSAVRRIGACQPARTWMAVNVSKSLREQWNTCPQPNWMAWVLSVIHTHGGFYVDWRRIALALVDTPLPFLPEAKTAHSLMPDTPIVHRLVQVARDCNAGRIEPEELLTVRSDAFEENRSELELMQYSGLDAAIELCHPDLHYSEIVDITTWIDEATFNYLGDNHLLPDTPMRRNVVQDTVFAALARAISTAVPYDDIRPFIRQWYQARMATS